MLFGTQLTRRDVMRADWRIRREDQLTMSDPLKRAWARREGERSGMQAAAPAAHGSPFRSQLLSNPGRFDRRFGGRGCGSCAMGR
jgi:hypothetical protein